MNCKTTIELLPWLLNGTLEATEERQARAHLETCDACREELRKTKFAWSLAEGHLPAEVLVDFALDGATSNVRRGLIESHLAICDRCNEELKLLRESPELEVKERPNPLSSTPRAGFWHRLETRSRAVVLAALLALIAGGGWFSSSQRIARERDAWRLRESELQTVIDTLKGPSLNTPILDLLPSTNKTVLRSNPESDSSLNKVVLPTEAILITLTLLSAGTEPATDLNVNILNAQDGLLWREEGLVRNSAGHFTLTVPTDLLPPGRSTIQITRGENELVARYLILARSSSP